MGLGSCVKVGVEELGDGRGLIEEKMKVRLVFVRSGGTTSTFSAVNTLFVTGCTVR